MFLAPAKPRPAVDLLVPEAVGGAIQTIDVEAVGFPAGGAPGDDDPIAGFQGVGDKADRLEFSTVVHVEAPGLPAVAVSHVDEWVRADEPKLDDDTVDGGFFGAVVDACDGVMCLGHRAGERQYGDDPHSPLGHRGDDSIGSPPVAPWETTPAAQPHIYPHASVLA